MGQFTAERCEVEQGTSSGGLGTDDAGRRMQGLSIFIVTSCFAEPCTFCLCAFLFEKAETEHLSDLQNILRSFALPSLPSTRICEQLKLPSTFRHVVLQHRDVQDCLALPFDVIE